MSRSQLLGYIRRAAQLVPTVTAYLNQDVRAALKAADDMAIINSVYHDAITRALVDYFAGGGSVTAPRNSFKRATVVAFTDAFFLGYMDGGGDVETSDDEINAWLDTRINQEFGYIDSVFQQAKQLRKEEGEDYFAWITARADAYTATLAGVYNSGMLFAKKNQMLVWRLGQTEKHCKTCASLNGKRHRASWYIAHDYIPRKPGAAMECGGYNCDCRLEDADGKEITL